MKKNSVRREITDEEIAHYLANKSQRMAMKMANKKMKSQQSISGNSNDSNPFGDSNLNDLFFWRKKFDRDITKGVPLHEFSIKSMKKRLRDNKAALEKLKKRREERALEKAQHEEEKAILARERARAEFQDCEKKEEEEDEFYKKLETANSLKSVQEEKRSDHCIRVDFNGGSFSPEVLLPADHGNNGETKPKYFIHVHTGYEWNKYNRTHYDHDNQPPKMVQGYKFDIFYPDLLNKSKAPTYTIEKDGSNSETCIIRFHAGAPYEDMAFRIVNKEWECKRKKGFKSAFERGVMQLHFNFKKHTYRR